MPFYFGGLGTIGFSKETTAGTAQTTVINFLSYESFFAGQEHKPLETKFGVGSMGNVPILQGQLTPKGKVTGVPMTASLPHPWYWVLGNNTTTGTGTPYTHTIKISTSDSSSPSLTCEGNKQVTNVKQAGCYMNKLTMKCSSGEIGKLDMEWLGLTHTDGATLTSTPTYTTDYLTFSGATITLAGTSATDVSDIELSIENQYEPTFAVGSRNPIALIRKGIPKISGKITFIDYPSTLYTNFIASTTFAIMLNFSAGTNKTLAINIPCAGIVKGFDKEIKAEVVTAEVDFEVYQDPATSNIITVTATNSVTSITN